MMDTIAIGDLHLGKQRLVGLFGRDVSKLQLEPVHRALSWSIKQNIPNAVFLGDVFDKPKPDMYSLMNLLQVLLRFDNKITMHFLLGNHDIASAGDNHSLSLIKNLADKLLKTVRVYDEPYTTKIGGITAGFQPWGEDVGDVDVGFGHFARYGAVRDNGYHIGKKDKDVWEPDDKTL